MSMNIIKRNPLFFKIALSGLLVAGGAMWFGGGSKTVQAAAVPAVAVSRPALTVRTTMLREDKWARTLRPTAASCRGRKPSSARKCRGCASPR